MSPASNHLDQQLLFSSLLATLSLPSLYPTFSYFQDLCYNVLKGLPCSCVEIYSIYIFFQNVM